MPTVYVTAPTDGAAELASTLVEERLAACVNRVPCQSTYRWDGEIHEDDEVVLFIKTTAETYPDLRDRVEELHPYDVPCIERFEESDILPAYENWRNENVED